MKRTFSLLLIGSLLFSCKQGGKQPVLNEAKKVIDTSATITGNTDTSLIKTVAPEQLIIPGKAIGKTAINEGAKEIIKTLGPADKGDAAMGKSLSTWFAKHDTAAYQTSIFFERQMGVDDTSRAKKIRITSPWFKTAEGIHCGSSLNEIKARFEVKKVATYTEGQLSYAIYDTEKGIAFEINNEDICTGIIVYEANTKVTASYLPFHSNMHILNE